MDNETPPEPVVQPCTACGQSVSRLAAACPHCGHPTERVGVAKALRARRLKAGLTLLAAVGGSYIAYTQINAASDYASSGGFYGCNNPYTIKTMKDAFQGIGLIKMMNITILDVRKTETVSNNPDKLLCHAEVSLSNATNPTLEYWWTKMDGKAYLYVKELDSQP